MNILSMLENRNCYICGRRDDGRSGLCQECQDLIIRSSMKKGGLCPTCSQPLLSVDSRFCPFCSAVPMVERIHSISYFNSYMKEIITLFKSGQTPGFRFFFADLIYHYMDVYDLLDAVIVPVPPRKGKIRDQGWDQVELLCKTLHRTYGVQISRVLKRIDRVQQKTLSFEERELHMKSILRYTAAEGTLDNARAVVLFDDIFTSGATISAAAELLRINYKGELTALVLCSVI
jgi:ComF family protein